MVGIKIDGYIVTEKGKSAADFEVIHSEFMELFLPFLESHGYWFAGGTDAQDLNKDDSKETVEIDKDEYDELMRQSKLLSCLHGAGVDNWDGYGEAWQMMEDEQ